MLRFLEIVYKTLPFFIPMATASNSIYDSAFRPRTEAMPELFMEFPGLVAQNKVGNWEVKSVPVRVMT